MGVRWIDLTIEQSISNPIPKLTGTIDGTGAFEEGDELVIIETDHEGTEHCRFVGFVYSVEKIRDPANDKSKIVAYGWLWFATVQAFEVDAATYTTWKPEDFIYRILQRTVAKDGEGNYYIADWRTYLRLYPFLITKWEEIPPLADRTWTPVPPTTNDMQSKFDILKKLCSDAEYIFHTIYRKGVVSGEPPANWMTLFCWFDPNYIDHDTRGLGLYLPSFVGFSNPNQYIVAPIKKIRSNSKKPNRVILYYVNDDGAQVITGQAHTASYIATERPVEYWEIREDGTNAIAEEILAQMNREYQTVEFKAKYRWDLELYQKIAIYGYEDISTDDMRIIGIKYIIGPGKKEVIVTASDKFTEWDVDGVQYRSYAQLSSRNAVKDAFRNDLVQTVEAVAKSAVVVPSPMIGTVTTVSGKKGNVTTEQGYVLRDVRYPANT